MQIDPEYLRRHYASLSDEALMALHRTYLVDIAQKCYDEDLARRGWKSESLTDLEDSPAAVSQWSEEPEVSKPHVDLGPEAKPDWLEDAACVFSFVARPRETSSAFDAADICEVLQAAGIPCHISMQKLDPPSRDVIPGPEYEYCVMVPGPLNLRAKSVLDKEIFNAKEEADWRSHFELLSNQDLRALNPESICAGLQDRIERLTRAYNNEIARRKRGRFTRANP